MKLSKRHNRGGNLQLNMTPMIDCVFLLLIFFMTCTQVSAINKTELELAKQKGKEDQTEADLIINIDKDGDILVSSVVVSVPQLIPLVDEAIAKKGGEAGNVSITLRVDRRAPSRVPNQVVEALERMKVLAVRIAVETPQ